MSSALEPRTAALPDPAMMPTIGEVDHHADEQPGDESRPVDPAELIHHITIEQNAESRNQRHPGRTEGPRLPRIGLAQDEHGSAHDYEGQERTDIHHLADVVDRCDTADDRREQTDENRILIGGAEPGMNGSEE